MRFSLTREQRHRFDGKITRESSPAPKPIGAVPELLKLHRHLAWQPQSSSRRYPVQPNALERQFAEVVRTAESVERACDRHGAIPGVGNSIVDVEHSSGRFVVAGRKQRIESYRQSYGFRIESGQVDDQSARC